MARIYPKIETDFHNSFGERQVFEAFKKLPDDWYVFHSVKWAERRRAGNLTWGEADFVILNQHFGILILEIKSGKISCRNGVFWQKRFDTGEEFEISPFEQADRSKYKILGELRKKHLANNCFVDKAVWFPSVEDFEDVELPLEYKKELILTERDLEEPLEALERVFRYYNAAEYTDLSEYDMDTILQILIPEFDLVPAFNAEKNELGFRFDQLTNEQKKVLDFIDDQDSVAISGAAGTGKTFVALEMARRFAVVGSRVLFLCFNRQLRDFLDAGNREESIKFYTIHQLLGEQGMLDGMDEARAVAIMQDFSFVEQGYRYCIIDEAQDFDGEVLEKLVKAAKSEQIEIAVFYDRNQLIIKSIMPEILSDFDCKLTLKNNCRNTIRIMETANSSMGLAPNPSVLSVEGTMPTLYFDPNRQTLLDRMGKVIKQYQQEGFRLQDITIITLKTIDESVLAGLPRIGKVELSGQRERGKVMLTTARKFKGLESDCVIIVDYELSDINNPEAARLFYVAASRARQKLSIFTQADVDIVNAVGKELEGVASPIMKVANKLKTKIEKA